MIEIRHSNGHHIGYDHLTFSGGEEHIRLKPMHPGAQRPIHIEIRADLRSSQDVMKLALISDALDREYGAPRHLVCPYIPYARQDRVCNVGEPLSAKVMCSMINAMGFAHVEVWDAHSDVVPALLDRCTNVPAKEFVHAITCITHDTILVAPDAGAVKRVMGCAAKNGNDVLVAEKVRDTRTGDIVNTSVNSPHVGKRDFLMVDDICDGGRTFIELARKLRYLTLGRTMLYVTHGIFSKGLDPLSDVIDHVFTPNSWIPHQPPFFTILNPGASK